MANLTPQTLIVAIQAVHTEIKNLEQQRKSAEGGEEADLDDLLASYQLAATDLRRAYEAARRETSNLPGYDDLIQA